MPSRKIDPVRTEQGRKLAALRGAHGLYQPEVAAECGVTKSAVSEWETGKSTPKVEHLGTLNRLFKYDNQVLAIYGIEVGPAAEAPAAEVTQPDDAPTTESLARDLSKVLELVDDLHAQWTDHVRDSVAARRRRGEATRP